MPVFVAQHLRIHKASQNERRLRSVTWPTGTYVFDRGAGVPMLLLSVSHRFSKWADALGLGDGRFHDLRHAYATRLLEHGVHPKVAGGGRRHRRRTQRVMAATWRQRSASVKRPGAFPLLDCPRPS
jgi:integrase